ncbi:MAG: tRNA pseudouridine(13) synthase TruD [Methanoregula sp.]|jgi:tRNA pseudouridine13 synthase
MKESTFPLERELGMRYYATDTEGIGGKLRCVPEDFVVKEIPKKEYTTTSGPYLICRLTKTNWELQHAIKELSRRLGISHRRIGWAGTKDKNAVTSQFISLYNVTREAIAEVRLKDITLDVIGQANEQLSLGDLKGNRFDILIRGTEHADLEKMVTDISATASESLPNYFGLQRFGVIRPLTHRIGELILVRDYESAVKEYVGRAFPHEPEDIQAIRSAFAASGDPAEALRMLPTYMAFERSMLHHLSAHPGDYAGALQQLPPKLLSMFVSAYQSWLFNCALSMRFEHGNTLTDPVPGDRLVFANGRTDVATAQNIHAVSLHIKRGRCTIALFMPGKEVSDALPVDPAIRELLTNRGITARDFEQASKFVKTKYDGAWRPISLKTIITSEVNGPDVRLCFTLPPGHYATTVCREFMKSDPLQMI